MACCPDSASSEAVGSSAKINSGSPDECSCQRNTLALADTHPAWLLLDEIGQANLV